MDTSSLGLDDEFMATMLSDFLDESQGYLTGLNENLLVLDQAVQALGSSAEIETDVELLNNMFRDAHSLKGLSAMLQLHDINSLTHKIENLFDAARGNQLTITRDVVDLMFQAFDLLTAMVEQLKNSGGDPVDAQPIVQQIQKLLENQGVARDQGSSGAVDALLIDLEGARAMEAGASAGGELEGGDLEEGEAKPRAGDALAGVANEEEIAEKYLSIFIDETEESLDALSERLLCDEKIEIDPLLVICHRIKGSAASIGLNRTAKLAHLMEDLLQELRDEGRLPASATVDALLVAADAIRQYVEVLKTGARSPDDFAAAYQTLAAARSGTPSPAHASPERDEPPPDDVSDTADQRAAPASEIDASTLERVAAHAPLDASALACRIAFEPGLPLASIKARMIANRLAAAGRLFYCDPPEDEFDEADEVAELVIGLSTDQSAEAIRPQIDLDGVQSIALEAVTAPGERDAADDADAIAAHPPGVPTELFDAGEVVGARDACVQVAGPQVGGPPVAKPQAARTPVGRPAETLRVDIDRLDQLMNLTGQLVINKARFGQIGDQLKELSSRKQSAHCLRNVTSTLDKILMDAATADESAADAHFVHSVRTQVQQIQVDLKFVENDIQRLRDTRNLVNELSEAVHQLDRVSDGIQRSVMDTRMVPIGPLFGRFRRVVRDITRTNSRDIQLVIRGEKTELDKRMIDELGDPLIHMVRNAADHGVESPADRVAAGKPRQGTITLDAFHRGNRVYIQVRDDGKGLDPEKLRAKAIEKGVIAAQDAERLNPQQALQLIWEPGFSTAEKVTEVSGRGMGMDIVRSKIEQINGTVELDSQLGAGTTITIKLPLTMAILPSLMTVIAGDVFAVPVESVVEIVRVRRRDLATVHGLNTARVRGRVISVVQLGELFQWKGVKPTEGQDADEQTLVIIGADGDELGIVVDSLLGEEDIVIKSLAENYRSVHGLSGASILGDGSVSLILDVAALLDLACRKNEGNEADAGVSGAEGESPQATSPGTIKR